MLVQASPWASVHATVMITSLLSSGNMSPDYLPRALYPGTYGNFCGPTPEINAPVCVAQGRYSNAPIDAVDEACMNHDLEYCQCESAWQDRRRSRGREADGSAISLLFATRFTAASSAALDARGVDGEYRSCIRRADIDLLERGIVLRARAQQSSCTAAGSGSASTGTGTGISEQKVPDWFCDPHEGTLGRFENVNLALFIRDVDDDLASNVQSRKRYLRQLETHRKEIMETGKLAGAPLSKTASSVKDIDELMLSALRDAKGPW